MKYFSGATMVFNSSTNVYLNIAFKTKGIYALWKTNQGPGNAISFIYYVRQGSLPGLPEKSRALTGMAGSHLIGVGE